jgi:hypothetical protein
MQFDIVFITHRTKAIIFSIIWILFYYIKTDYQVLTQKWNEKVMLI